VLADDLAQTVPNLRATAVVIAVRALWRKLLDSGRNGSDFLDRAEADTISLAQGAVDGSCLGHAHLGPANKRRDIGRIGVAVADEVLRFRFVDGCFEDPAALFGIGNAF